MSGMQEMTREFLNKINNVLEHEPEYMRSFVNYMTDSSIRTKYNYLNHVCAFMKFVNKEPEHLTFDDFNNYMTEISYKEDGKQTSSSYRINIYSSLKRFSDYLYASKRIPENYMINIKRPKAKESQETIKKREKGYLTEDEIKIYLNALENKEEFNRKQTEPWVVRDKAIILTFLTTGIRNSALRMLDVEDVDLKHKTMMVTDKGEKVRMYDLSDKLCKVLKEWLKWRKKLIEKISNGTIESNALFISNEYKRMSIVTVYNIIKKYAEHITDKNVTPHKLRATYGTQLYNKTGDIYFVQQCMGHNDPHTTELYVRDKKKNTKRASEIMDSII